MDHQSRSDPPVSRHPLDFLSPTLTTRIRGGLLCVPGVAGAGGVRSGGPLRRPLPRSVAATSLAVLAETLGCTEAIVAKLVVHRAERASYRRALRIVTPLSTGHTAGGVWTGPPPDGETALEILERILGARRIA